MTDALRDQLQTSLGIACTSGRELGGGGMSRAFVEPFAVRREARGLR